jgi:hypothetical protein
MPEPQKADIPDGTDARSRSQPPLVPDDFVVPEPPRTSQFWLEPLGEQHNQADYEAWTSSLDHIRSTAGFPFGDWPHPMSLEANADDLRMHARDFEERRGFTYTVRSTTGDDVIGCVYIYPSPDAEADVSVRSWVRASHAELDTELWSTVLAWLCDQWPFDSDRIAYAPRST